MVSGRHLHMRCERAAGQHRDRRCRRIAIADLELPTRRHRTAVEIQPRHRRFMSQPTNLRQLLARVDELSEGFFTRDRLKSHLDAYRPLEVAVETATVRLIEWLVSDYGFKPVDAYCLVSTCPDFRINVYQMCKIGKLSYVAGAEIPKRYVVG